MGGLLMIAGNEGPIKACAAAFLAILVEMDRRGVDRQALHSGPGAAHGGTTDSVF
jgi:hypothetical protein